MIMQYSQTKVSQENRHRKCLFHLKLIFFQNIESEIEMFDETVVPFENSP
jgi:hypothetical protein